MLVCWGLGLSTCFYDLAILLFKHRFTFSNTSLNSELLFSKLSFQLKLFLRTRRKLNHRFLQVVWKWAAASDRLTQGRERSSSWLLNLGIAVVSEYAVGQEKLLGSISEREIHFLLIFFIINSVLLMQIISSRTFYFFTRQQGAGFALHTSEVF